MNARYDAAKIVFHKLLIEVDTNSVTDVEIKSSPNVSNSWPKRNHYAFYLKINVFKIVQN